MKKIFNIILFALFCTSFAQAQVGKTFEFTYEGQTLKYEVANGNEAKVSKQQSAKISGDVKIPESVTFEGKKYTVTSIGWEAFEECKGYFKTRSRLCFKGGQESDRTCQYERNLLKR